jgi:cytochrome P450
MGWASANRDPKVFEDPDTYRIDRPQRRHMSFGWGVHTCPGAALARIELRVLLEELLRRVPDLEVMARDPVYHFGGGDYNCIESLPVKFTPGKRERSVADR